jgi:hypothetical protein
MFSDSFQGSENLGCFLGGTEVFPKWQSCNLPVYSGGSMLLGTLTPDKKDTMAALLSQGFQEIATLSENGKIQEAKSLVSALAPISASLKDPCFDLRSTASAFARHHRGYPPRHGRTDWLQVWARFVSNSNDGPASGVSFC